MFVPQMRADLPDMFDQIQAYTSILPGRTSPPAYPFGGFVLNINIATTGHRDGMDLYACLVIPLGTYQHGELVLYEPGLVLPLRSGDGVIFPSCQISHFNMPYSGTRSSLVCHSDRAGMEWVQGRLGWSNNQHFRQ